MADEMTSTSTFGPNAHAAAVLDPTVSDPGPVPDRDLSTTSPQTTPPGGVLRCAGCGTEGQHRPEGFWQCPTCGLRLESSPAGANEQPAIPVGSPQPLKQQDLQLIPAAQQPDALDAENDRLAENPTVTTTSVVDGATVEDTSPSVNSLTASTPEETPDYVPANTPPPADVAPGWTEPEPAQESTGGREGDPTLGKAAEPSHPVADDFRQEQPMTAHDVAIEQQKQVNDPKEAEQHATIAVDPVTATAEAQPPDNAPTVDAEVPPTP